MLKGYQKVQIEGFHGFVREPWPSSIPLRELLPEIGQPTGLIVKMRANRAIKIRGELHLKEEFFRGWRSWPLLFKGLLGRSRLRRQWLASLLASKRGIPTPDPVAYLERRWGLLPSIFLLATRYELNFTTLTHYLRGKTRDEGWVSLQGRGFLEGLATAVRSMHEKGMIHHDLKGSNILVREDGEIWSFLFTDLKASRFRNPGSSKMGIHTMGKNADIIRLLAALRAFFPLSERSLFLQSYLSLATEEAKPIISWWETQSLHKFPPPKRSTKDQV